MMRRWVVIPVLVLAACGGGSGSGSSATTAVEVSVLAPTTAAPTTTVAPTTTTIPATTTTETATTTTVPIEDQLRVAVVANYVAYDQCLADPAVCRPELLSTGDALNAITATVKDMIEYGLYSAPNGDDPERVVVGAVAVAPDRMSATIELCRWDTAIIYSRASVAGDPATVVNDAKETHWIKETWLLSSGTWLPANVVEAAPKVDGEDRCGA